MTHQRDRRQDDGVRESFWPRIRSTGSLGHKQFKRTGLSVSANFAPIGGRTTSTTRPAFAIRPTVFRCAIHLGLWRDDPTPTTTSTRPVDESLIGSYPAEAHPVSLLHLLQVPGRNNARADRLHPRFYPATAAHAMNLSGFRPDPDVALIWGILYHIFENGWEDKNTSVPIASGARIRSVNKLKVASDGSSETVTRKFPASQLRAGGPKHWRANRPAR